MRTPTLRTTTRVRPQLSALEARLAPAVVNWTFGAAGDYGIASNWTVQGTTEHRVPLATDDAVGASFAITSTGNVTVNSVFANDFRITGGTFSISASGVESYISLLSVSAGASLRVTGGDSKVGINGSSIAGNLDVEGSGTLWFRRETNNLNAGTTLTGPGQFLIQDDLSPAGNHSVVLNAPVTAPANLVFSGGLLTGSANLTVPSGVTFHWVNPNVDSAMRGTGMTIVQTGGTLVMGGARAKELRDRTIANSGTLLFQDSGVLSMADVAKIDNLPNATFRLETTAPIIGYGNVPNLPQVTNEGHLIEAASGTTTISSIFANTGTVTAQSGTLNLAPNLAAVFTAGANLAGTFQLTGGDLALAPTNFNYLDINAGASFTGTGGAVVVAGGARVTAPVSVPNFRQTGGTLGGAGTLTITNSGNWTGGQMIDDGNTTVATGATLTLTGAETKNLTGTRTLSNAGTINHLGGGDLFVTAAIVNQATGTFNLGDTNLSFGGTSFTNAGLFVKSSPNGMATTSSLNLPFTNTGTLRVDSGTLAIGTDVTQTAGSTTVANGATLQLVSPIGQGTFHLDGGTLLGDGTVRSNLSGNGTLAPNKLTFFAANIFGDPGLVDLAGPFAIDLNGLAPGTQYDQIVVNGRVMLGGPLNVTTGFTPAIGTTFTIIDNDGTDAITGTFTGLPQAATITAGGMFFAVSYFGGTGNDVTLTRVNTPSAPHATASVNGGAIQRSRVTSVAVTFDAIVSFAGAPANAFTLTRNGGGAVAFTASVVTGNNTTTVTMTNFTGGETESGSLRDGRYTLTALANQVSVGGVALDGDNNGSAGGDFTFGDAQGLFRYYGDMNADRRVDISDFGFFSLAYLTPANYNPALDFNNDGRIDIADFGQFSVRFFTSLP